MNSILLRTVYATLALSTLILAETARAEELKTLSGPPRKGKLIEISDAQIVFEGEKGPVKTPLAQALAIEWRATRPPSETTVFHEVRLIDDSILRCQAMQFVAENADLTLASGAKLRVPVTQINSILRNAQTPGLSEKFDRLARERSRRDRILVLRGGELNAIDGLLGAIDASKQTISFKREELEPINVAFDKMAGLIFVRTDLPAEAAVCKVVDIDGSVLMASKLRHDGKTLSLVSTSGQTLPVDLNTLAKLDFNLGRLSFLSDLEPAKIVESPWLGGLPSFRRDKNVDGGPILFGDTEYAKGISLYANSEVEYKLGGKYREFRALAGIDTRLAEEGSVLAKVQIYCDGKLEYQKDVTAKETQGLKINVKDVQTLRIVVRGSNFAGFSAHATLAEPRISQ